MKNNDSHQKHFRGSSGLQEAEKSPEAPAPLPSHKQRKRSIELPPDVSESPTANTEGKKG